MAVDVDMDIAPVEDQVDEEANGPGEGDQPIELTDRELAIIAGLDPDSDEGVAEGPAGEDNEEAEEEEEEDESGSAGEEAVQDEPGGKEAAPLPWITDEVKAKAAAYGISDEELSGFSSLDEFTKTASLLDRITSGKGSDTSDAEPDTEQEAPADEGPTDIDVDFFINEGYDEQTVNLVKFAKQSDLERRALAQKLDAAQQLLDTMQLERSQSLSDQFHDTLDTMDESIYGRSIVDGRVVELAPEHEQNREKALHQFKKLLAGEEQVDGRRSTPIRELLRQAEQIAFGDVIKAKEKAARAAKLAAQSKKRRSVAGGNREPVAPQMPSGDNDAITRIVNDPKVVAAWRKAQEENGDY